jgi:hypothetical protein
MSVDKYRTREEWFMLAKDMLSSVQTQKAWCAKHGVNLSAMRSYLKRSRLDVLQSSEGKSSKQQVAWIEVTEASGGSTNTCAPMLEVFVGSCKVKVPSGFDGTTFAKVCEILRNQC